MNTTSSQHWLAGGVVFLALFALGCEADSSGSPDAPSKDSTKSVETSRKMIGKNVYFETQGEQRRVIVTAVVCLREGQLEGLLCRTNTKEHEYILAADCDARHIHAALIAARAKPGSPVKFEPKYVPAHGSAIKITLQYESQGKLMNVPAQKWIRNTKDQKDLDVNWVFGGSQFIPDPTGKDRPPLYLANQGDVICTCNMDDAMLDLPIKSDKTIDLRSYEANTDRIPPMGTKVAIILEAMPDKGK